MFASQYLSTYKIAVEELQGKNTCTVLVNILQPV